MFVPLNHSNATNQEPPSALMTVMAFVYGICVLFGVLGNATVIIMIVRVLRNSRKVIHVYLYVLCLSATDFVYLLAAPITIIYMLSEDWFFGWVVCKLSFACEGLNKTQSVCLLAVLSGDRYLAVCRTSVSNKYRNLKWAIRVLCGTFALAFVSNLPIYIFATVGVDRLGRRQCALLFPTFSADPFASRWYRFAPYYTIFLLILYFVTPAVLISFFYTEALVQLSRQDRLTERRVGRRRRVTKSVAWVVLFYFICWTPYWLIQGIIQFFPTPRNWERVLLLVCSVIYTFPYINSAINPVLYAFLNKSLTQAYSQALKHRSDRVLHPDEDFEDIGSIRSRARSISRWLTSRSSFRPTTDENEVLTVTNKQHQTVMRTRSSTLTDKKNQENKVPTKNGFLALPPRSHSFHHNITTSVL